MTVAFAFLAGMTLVSALGVVLSRSVVHSALLMSGSFLGVSGFFVMLNAPALAAFQVLIYVGAVTVVILFGIMFTFQWIRWSVPRLRMDQLMDLGWKVLVPLTLIWLFVTAGLLLVFPSLGA